MAAVALAAALTVVSTGRAETPRATPEASASADDDATVHRRFDDVAKWSKVFDDPKRDEWQKPDALVATLAIRPGDTVADIGAGTGYFEKRLSAAVGPDGKVFAVEVEVSLVDHLRERAIRERTANVEAVLASADDPRLPDGAIDLALIVDSYHHIDDRRQWLARLRKAMKSAGRIAIVDWKPGRLPVGPREEEHKIAAEKVVAEMTAAGFERLPVADVLPHQYLLMFRLREAAP
jgi:ubiquinone/menaquinone biosynthesis C-methylase UbiE